MSEQKNEKIQVATKELHGSLKQRKINLSIDFNQNSYIVDYVSLYNSLLTDSLATISYLRQNLSQLKASNSFNDHGNKLVSSMLSTCSYFSERNEFISDLNLEIDYEENWDGNVRALIEENKKLKVKEEQLIKLLDDCAQS